jgi:hypothetical protein
VNEFLTRRNFQQEVIDAEEKDGRWAIQGRQRRFRFPKRQKTVFVHRTFLGRRVFAKVLICPGFFNPGKAFGKRILTSRDNALDCAVR